MWGLDAISPQHLSSIEPESPATSACIAVQLPRLCPTILFSCSIAVTDLCGLEQH